ncbi:MAG: TMEM175 family protein [Acidobacteriota bacterium]|nr:TMEM175 family protein [Acidobacteriota bacterium]
MPRRAHDVTRLEGFSDAVFGFALTLLVVSLETPRSVAELRVLAQGFVPFALTFAMVCWIWYQHNIFFRRYGLQDPWIAFLNAVLLFVVLFYVYPLKFITAVLVGPLVFGSASTETFGTLDDSRMVMLLYSSGVVLIFGTFLLLYRHAWRLRAELALDASDEIVLRYHSRAHLISMSLGVVSIAIVLAQARLAGVAGLIYVLMGPLHGWNGYQQRRALERLEEAVAAVPASLEAQAESVELDESDGGVAPS